MHLKKLIENLEQLDDNQFKIGLGLTKPQFEKLFKKFQKLKSGDLTRKIDDDREKLYAILIAVNWNLTSNPTLLGHVILDSGGHSKRDGETFIENVTPRLQTALDASNIVLAAIPKSRKKKFPQSLDKILDYIHAENQKAGLPNEKEANTRTTFEQDLKTERDLPTEPEKPVQPQPLVTVKDALNPATSANPLLEILKNKLMGEKQSSTSSLSQTPHTPTDIKTLDSLVCDLQEIEKEKKGLEETSQELETQSQHLQETLQKEITAQESEYTRLEQQQAAFQKQISDLQENLTQKSSTEQQSIQNSLKALQEQLSIVQAQQAILWNEHQVKAQKREALKRFQSHPNLLLFYRTVHIKLEEIFISFKTVAGGFVDPVDGNVAIVKSIFDAIGDAASIAPIVGTTIDKVLKWTVSKGLEKVDSARQRNTAINTSALVTLSEVKKYAESIARQLTERYADQLERLLMTPEEEQAGIGKLQQGLTKVKERVLKDLPVPPAKQLATFGVFWIVNELYDAENIDISKELDETLLSAISQKTPPNKLKEFWQEITTKLGINGVRSKTNGIWHPEAVYTLPGFKVGNEYYSSETLQPNVYGWRLGTVQEVKALGLIKVQAPTSEAFMLETQKVVKSISDVSNTVKKVEEKTDENNTQLEALKIELEQTKKELKRLAELHTRAESPTPSPRRLSGIKDFKKKDEKENILDALRELRKFFMGQRDSGAQSLNLETYEKYLRLASDKCVKIDNKYVELIYKQKDEKHVLCLDGNELDATAAAQVILQMIKDVESQSFQETSLAHHSPAMLTQFHKSTTATTQKTPSHKTNNKNHCSVM